MSKEYIATTWAERATGLTGDRTNAPLEKREQFYTEFGRAVAILSFAESMGLKVELPLTNGENLALRFRTNPFLDDQTS